MFWNEQCDFIATIDSDQRQTDPGVPRRRFDNRASAFEQPLLLGAPNDPNGSPVLHTPTRIQAFQLGVDFCRTRRNQLFQLKDRGFADQLGNVIGDPQASALDCFDSHPTGYGSEGRASIEQAALSSQPITVLTRCREARRVAGGMLNANKVSGEHTDEW